MATITGMTNSDIDANVLIGTPENDLYLALDGDDELVSSVGDDTMDCGAGRDMVFYTDDPAGGMVDLAAGTVTDGFGDTGILISIERIRGTNFDDSVAGSDAAERFEGEDGNDLLSGGGGADRIEGDDGDDTLEGGAGTDTLTGGDGADWFVIGTGNEQVLITDFELGTDLLDLAAFSRADALVALAGATGGSAVLTLSDDTVVTVGGTGVTHETLTESDLVLAAPPNNPPTGSVTIEGEAREGETLTANISNIVDADGIRVETIAYQWLRDGSDITGATAATYALTAADVGADITVQLSFTDEGDTVETLTSAALVPIAANAAPTGAVAITGEAVEGETLSADTSTVTDPDGIRTETIAYQWLRDGTEIAGATDATYELVTADVGKNISVRFSYTDDGNTVETLTSATVAPKAAPILVGGDASDETLSGGDGDDTLAGEGGNDTLIGDRETITSMAGQGSTRLPIPGVRQATHSPSAPRKQPSPNAARTEMAPICSRTWNSSTSTPTSLGALRPFDLHRSDDPRGGRIRKPDRALCRLLQPGTGRGRVFLLGYRLCERHDAAQDRGLIHRPGGVPRRRWEEPMY